MSFLVMTTIFNISFFVLQVLCIFQHNYIQVIVGETSIYILMGWQLIKIALQIYI